jgi:hypothetical protein
MKKIPPLAVLYKKQGIPSTQSLGETLATLPPIVDNFISKRFFYLQA